jgi:hypothetical protein
MNFQWRVIIAIRAINNIIIWQKSPLRYKKWLYKNCCIFRKMIFWNTVVVMNRSVSVQSANLLIRQVNKMSIRSQKWTVRRCVKPSVSSNAHNAAEVCDAGEPEAKHFSLSASLLLFLAAPRSAAERSHRQTSARTTRPRLEMWDVPSTLSSWIHLPIHRFRTLHVTVEI